MEPAFGLAWECQRSVDAEVPARFAWQFMTNVANWSDPPADFTLEGPFVAGARGTTRLSGELPLHWVISHVETDRGYTIEGSGFFERAQMRVHWRFDPLSQTRSRLTQRLELLGENAAAYVNDVRAAFEPNLEPGMTRIAESMGRAFIARRPD
jgi:hypothetical protein